MSKKIFTIDKKINNIYQYINHSKLIYEKSAYAWELVLEARKKIISRYSYKNKKFIMDVIDNLNNKGFYEYKNFLNHEEVLNICNYLNNNRTYSLKQLRKFSKKIDKLLSLLNVLSCKLPEKIVYEFQNIPPRKRQCTKSLAHGYLSSNLQVLDNIK